MSRALVIVAALVALAGCGSSQPSTNSTGTDRFVEITVTVDGHPLRCVQGTAGYQSISCDWQGWHNQ